MYLMRALTAGLTLGSLIGIIPIAYGAAKKKVGTGIAGFVCCAASAILVSWILAVPVCVLFLLFVARPEKQ